MMYKTARITKMIETTNTALYIMVDEEAGMIRWVDWWDAWMQKVGTG